MSRSRLSEALCPVLRPPSKASQRSRSHGLATLVNGAPMLQSHLDPDQFVMLAWNRQRSQTTTRFICLPAPITTRPGQGFLALPQGHRVEGLAVPSIKSRPWWRAE